MCIPPNPRRVGYIDPIDGPLYMGSHIHQQCLDYGGPTMVASQFFPGEQII